MATKRIHRITKVNVDRRIGNCRVCGRRVPVSLRNDRGRTYWFCKLGAAARQRAARNPGTQRADNLRRNFGLTVAEYDALNEAQAGLCAICKRPCPTGRRLAVDHDHDTNEIRGLLCNPCNRGVGLFSDDPDRLRAAAEYLSTH